MSISASELILNQDGSIYHLCLKPAELHKNIILVGDPDRVPRISCYFDRINFRRENREFHIHGGELNGKSVMVVSTGIGIGAIDIVMNELDALANIDFETRQIKSQITSLNIIRLGTAGCLQPEIELGSVCVSRYAFAFDGFLQFYQSSSRPSETQLIDAIKQHFARLPVVSSVYAAEASSTWLDRLNEFTQGITLTCPGFFGPQYRHLRAPLIDFDFLKVAQAFRYDDLPIINYEMETAAILGLAQLLGHQACSVSCLIANRAKGTFVEDPQKAVDEMIETMIAIV